MQALALAISKDYSLLIQRLKALWEICKGLAVAVVGGILVGILAILLPGLAPDAPSWWLWLFEVLPLAWAYHFIAPALPGLFKRVITDAPGTARMGDLKDLEEAGLIGEPNKRPHDIYCGVLGEGEKAKPVHYSGDRHIISLGSTRRGKDTGLTVQNLALLERSFVVIDPSGELAAITMQRRKKLGPVIVINPFGVLTKTHPHLKSDGFNPFAANFRLNDQDFFGKTMGLAEALIKQGSASDAHWTKRARGLVAALIMYAVHENKGGRATIGHVNEMLTAPLSSKDKRVTTLEGIMEKISNHKDKQMAQLAPSFTDDDGDDREIKSVVATALGQMTFLNDRTLVEDLDKHPTIDGKPFDFEMLKHQLITVYVILPDDMLTTYAVWLRLIVSSALNAMKRTVPGAVRPVLLLNEIGNLGHMESLETGMGMAAKKGVTIWCLFQSLAQISRNYGDHGRETFISGAGVLNSFKADDWETAEYISKRLGRRTEVVKSINNDDGSNETPQGFPLMHPDQIMALPPRELLSWIEPARYPVKLNATGYFDQPWIKGMAPNPYYVPRV